jgi:hypothetical protein
MSVQGQNAKYSARVDLFCSALELGHHHVGMVGPKSANNGRERLQHKLFDHVVSGGEQRRRHHNSERLCGLEIDGEIELGRLHHW